MEKRARHQLDDEAVAMLDAARVAADFAYAPFSGFSVGAAARTSTGELLTGCNVENSSYGLTICAERVAVFRAIAMGARSIAAIAIFTRTSEPSTPCGACRQVLAEFAGDDLPVYLGCDTDEVLVTTLGALLPRAFRLGHEA
ncbi:MAG: cytidine deaminase [Planctomycetes bacterium]|nr:cytidine deaminase [Planctomycetota bacterium]